MTLPVILLVEPQLGENIGAAARAMGNFGLSELRIVSPRDGWPNQQAIAMAAHAASIIDNAGIFHTVEEAIADIHYLYAATARDRYMAKPVTAPREMAANMHQLAAQGSKCAIMFGPERTGLTNEAVTLANHCVTIPINPLCPSINLAQSVAILCYEWFTGAAEKNRRPLVSDPATNEEIIGLFNHLEETLEVRNFFKVPEKKAGMVRNIRNIFKRIEGLSGQDVRTLRGIIRCLDEHKQ
jgi:tRNA/rRNA methyltransferase